MHDSYNIITYVVSSKRVQIGVDSCHWLLIPYLVTSGVANGQMRAALDGYWWVASYINKIVNVLNKVMAFFVGSNNVPVASSLALLLLFTITVQTSGCAQEVGKMNSNN